MRLLALVLAFALACALPGCAGSGSQRPQATGSDADSVHKALQGAPPPLSAAPVLPQADPPVVAPEPLSAPASPTPAVAPTMAMSLIPAKPAAPAVPERYISLNFDNADISLVIQTIAELLHMNYIVAPTVRGRISIQTSEKLPVSSLLPVLEQILEVNGFMAVKSGDFFKIVPSNQAKQEAVETVMPEGAASVGTGLVTKIVRLRYISPGEVVKILTPFKTAAGVYQAHEPARLLFLTEVPAKIADLTKIIEVLDVDTFASIQVELYPVRYAGVEDLARELTQIVTQVFTAAGRGRSLFRIIPVTQVNAIMVFSGEQGLTVNIREWIAKLDQPASEANERIFVYPLSHATAEALAAVLEKVFHRDTAKSQAKSATPTPGQPTRNAPVTGQPTAASPMAAPATVTPSQGISSAGEGGSASGGAAVTIVPDKDTNSLIIQTASWFYPTVEQVIRRLDTMPKQVLIEVLIAEVSLDDTNKYGINWSLNGQGSVKLPGETLNLSTSSALNAVADASAFTFSVVEAGRISAAITAYAQDSKLNILSAPHILATNNKEAKIDVGQEVPILTSQTTSTTTGTDPTTTQPTDIEYRNTGIILTVTPHINDGGYVTLDVLQEVSEAQENKLGGTTSPIIRKRTAKTTMVVKDDQTLVVGGLIAETRTNTQEGLPWLKNIPVLGYLFGSKSIVVSRTELVLLITPHVIYDVEEGDKLTQQVKDRILTLKKGIGEFRTLSGKGTK
jgi:general secretion pathway protein D